MPLIMLSSNIVYSINKCIQHIFLNKNVLFVILLSCIRVLFVEVQVWEVLAQLIGLALSVGLLNGIEATGDTTNAVWAWVVIQSVHVTLRFKSLSVIQLPTLNQKRSCALVNAFLEGRPLPGSAGCPC